MSTASRHRIRVGVDLGGTKIEAVVVDLGPGEPDTGAAPPPSELARARIATNRTQGYEHVLSETRALVFEVAKLAGIDPISTPIGVGMPGSVTMQRAGGGRSDLPLVKNSNTTCLNGKPFHADLAKAVGRPIAFANDANCFALAEATWGAARGARVAFGVILGTGVGGGVVVDGKPLTGAQAIAGEWGHNPLPLPHDDERPGPPCYCGRTGCIETWLSGPRLQQQFERRTGRVLRATEIAEAALAGDEHAQDQMEIYCDRLARGLAGIINVLDPHAIVLGGGLSKIRQLYERVPTLWKRYVFSEPEHIATRLLPPMHGDSSGVRGAAWLWPE